MHQQRRIFSLVASLFCWSLLVFKIRDPEPRRLGDAPAKGPKAGMGEKQGSRRDARFTMRLPESRRAAASSLSGRPWIGEQALGGFATSRSATTPAGALLVS